MGNRAGDGAKIALGCTALAFPYFCSRARVSVRAISQRTARDVDANVTVEKGYLSLHCAIATISLPLKEQLVVSCSTALGCQRGSDQPSLVLCFMRREQTQQRPKHSPEKKKLGDVCVPGASRAGCNGASQRADIGSTQLCAWTSLVKGKTHTPRTHPGCWETIYKFTLSTRDAQRGSPLLLACLVSKAL